VFPAVGVRMVVAIPTVSAQMNQFETQPRVTYPGCAVADCASIFFASVTKNHLETQISTAFEADFKI
jgi:hypothetical protein